MPQPKNHDLFDFMLQMSNEMAAEYDRIQMRATEDPGTAGDQGEENWAEILRGWLPRTFEVVTKGRIISQEGITSPQIDVLVLSDVYPKKLINKKLYLAPGVVAAFECKTTLKASHIAEAMENCTKIKSLYPSRIGSPFKELHSPLVYGLLAHSHVWKGETSTPELNIEKKLLESDAKFVSHPRLQLDLLCVADLATWVSSIITFLGPRQVPAWSSLEPLCGPNGSTLSSYSGNTRLDERQTPQFTPIGVLVSYLIQKMAWEDPSLRNLADYYGFVEIAGKGGKGCIRAWPSSIFSDEIRGRIEAGTLSSDKPWDEWHVAFM